MPLSTPARIKKAITLGMHLRLTLTLLLCSPLALGAIYRWSDAEGVTHFTDRRVANSRIVRVDPQVAWYRVAKVHDGDTLQLEDGRKIRLLGINTPEIESRHRSGEPGGIAARNWLTSQIGHGKIRLEWDQQKQDHYGRWLAHLFTEQQLHLNLELVRAGLATVSLIPPNTRYSATLLAAQQQAEQQQLGIWSMSAYQPRSAEQAIASPRHGWQRILARPQAVRPGRTYIRLSLSAKLDVKIPKTALVHFPPLEHYLHRPVEIRGWLSRHKDSYSILVRHPSALITLD